ncbi:MAG: GNAT family N-acetyltransferase [Thermomicrobiales bacterium]
MSEQAPDGVRNGIVALPNADGGKATRLALYRDNEELSETWIVPYVLRIGAATVRMDGIGGVATPEEHRNKGYSRKVLTAAVEYMKAGDAHLTALYGIPHYYPRWGYATAAHEERTRLVKLDADNVVADGFQVRPATAADLDRIRMLYRDGTRTLVGAAVRADDDTAWQELGKGIETDSGECRVVGDETDEVLAYAWQPRYNWWMGKCEREDPQGLHIGEAFAMTPRAADALLAGLRGWATETGKTHVDLHQPSAGALGMAVRLQDTETLTQTARDAEFMARSVGTASLVSALEPELRQRWLAVRPGWTGTLKLMVDGEAVGIALSADDLVVGDAGERADMIDVDLVPGDLARLVLGTFPPHDLLDRIGVARDVADVLAVLFPERHPYIYPADRF